MIDEVSCNLIDELVEECYKGFHSSKYVHTYLCHDTNAPMPQSQPISFMTKKHKDSNIFLGATYKKLDLPWVTREFKFMEKEVYDQMSRFDALNNSQGNRHIKEFLNFIQHFQFIIEDVVEVFY